MIQRVHGTSQYVLAMMYNATVQSVTTLWTVIDFLLSSSLCQYSLWNNFYAIVFMDQCT